MNLSFHCRMVLATVLAGVALPVSAGTITLDLCPAGTTSNLNIFGTTLSGGVATWPSKNSQSYRDYQFQLQTSSGSATFDDFSVLLSASLRNNTASSNLLRATLWAGPIVDNPLLANSLTTISVTNAAIASSGFSTKVTLTGPTFSTATIGTSPSTFFFRVWAEGAGSVNGYQTKMANTIPELDGITMSPDATIDGGIFDGSGGGNVIDPFQEIVPSLEVVPEIDPAGIGAALTLVGGVLGLLERRRRRA